MFNLNSDGSASPYASQQLNPWNNGLAQPLDHAGLGHAGLQAWQQQLALQQLLAQQLSNATPWGASPHMAALPQMATQHWRQPIAAQIRAQQIAQLLQSLAQQLLQLASLGNQFSAQPLPISPLGQFSHSQGQQFAPPPQHLGLH